ncbi:hypothetical protein ACOMHN_060135 [Nucella lapillus]
MGASESSIESKSSVTVNHPHTGKEIIHKENDYTIKDRAEFPRWKSSQLESHKQEVEKENSILNKAKETALGLRQQNGEYLNAPPPYRQLLK